MNRIITYVLIVLIILVVPTQVAMNNDPTSFTVSSMSKNSDNMSSTSGSTQTSNTISPSSFASRSTRLKTDQSSSDLPIPINLLYDLLDIPIQEYTRSASLLIIGSLFPTNFTRRFGGRLTVDNFHMDDIKVVNNSEIENMVYFLLDSNYTMFKNLDVTWLGISFGELTSQSLYTVDLVKHISSIYTSDYDGVLVLGNYGGDPLDSFSFETSKFNTLNSFVVSYAQLQQTGGTMLSPSSNPNTIAISNLQLAGDGYSSFSNLSSFRSRLSDTALVPNNFERAGADFALPGETLVLSNSSRQFPSGDVKLLSSKYLPTAIFALGLLSMKERYPGKIPTAEFIQHIIQHAIPLPEKTTSVGYGIPRFSNDDSNGSRYFRSFELDPFQQGKTPVVITSGQIISPTIEVNPYFKKITLDNVTIRYNDQVLVRNLQLQPSTVFVDTISQIFDGFPRSWILPKIFQPTITINNIPDGVHFQIIFQFTFDGQQVIKSFNLVSDNSRKLVAVPVYMEGDGLYDRDDITGRFYQNFQNLQDNGWSFSLIRTPSVLQHEIETLQHDCVMLIDPEIVTSNDTTLFSDYVAAGGNIVVFPDYQDPIQLRSTVSDPLLQYGQVSPNLIHWLADQGLLIQPWNHTDYPTLLFARETGSFTYSSNFYYVTWDHNISSLSDYELIPFRGYQISTTSYTNQSVTSENEVFQPYAVSKYQRGQIAVMGSISPLISSFTDIGFAVPNIDTAQLLGELLQTSSGTRATLNVNLKDPAPSLGSLRTRIDVSGINTKQEFRWTIQIHGSEIFDRQLSLADANHRTISVYPLLGYRGSSNFTVSLLFNQHSIASVTLSFTIKTPLLNTIVMVLLWLLVCITGGLLYRRYKMQGNSITK